jgi:steroid 5-alpha reductase family enzyme
MSCILPIEFLIFVKAVERVLKFMKNSFLNKKFWSFSIVLAVYILAFLAGFLIYAVSKYKINILLITFIADVTATLIVWGAGLVFNNSSTYDPYWSVAPAVIVPFWIIIKKSDLSAAVILMLAVLIIWAVRLTLNWALRWNGLKHEDWRYLMLKDKSPRMWFLTNLIGINLMPTAIVYLVLLPVYYSIGFTGGINYLIITGFIISTAAVIIQTISDAQMDIFRKSDPINNISKINRPEYKVPDSNIAYDNIPGHSIGGNNISGINSRENDIGRKINYPKNSNIDMGLWRHSRHPNYFGEVLFWWGLWVMQMGINPQKWITVAGPVIMVFLFVFISIPMMEKHIIESKPDYLLYKKRVSMLIPWFRIKIDSSKINVK